MKNTPIRTWGSFVLAGFLLGGFCFTAAAEQPAGNSNARILRELEVNRALLLRFRSEFERLKIRAQQHPSGLLQKEIENAEYKIKAMSDDASNLISSLPEEQQANEFLKYMTAKTAKIRPAPEEEPIAIKPSPAPTVPAEIHAPTAAETTAPSAPLNPKDRTYAMHEQALGLISQNRLVDALKIYQEIVLIDPDDDQAYMIMGHTFMLVGDFNRSAEAFKNAVEIDGQNTASILPFYQNMILKNPGDDKAHTYIGYVYLMLGDSDKAKAAFKDALAINPANQAASSGLRIAVAPQ